MIAWCTSSLKLRKSYTVFFIFIKLTIEPVFSKVTIFRTLPFILIAFPEKVLRVMSKAQVAIKVTRVRKFIAKSKTGTPSKNVVWFRVVPRTSRFLNKFASVIKNPFPVERVTATTCTVLITFPTQKILKMTGTVSSLIIILLIGPKVTLVIIITTPLSPKTFSLSALNIS